MATNSLTQTAYAEHLRGCADLAIEITARMNIHDDSARQATFATVIINAERHNIFMEPTPRHSAAPVTESVIDPNDTADADQKAAAKADAQIQDATKHPSPEEAEAGAVKALKGGIKRVCLLLNQVGYVPALSNATKDGKPSTLDQYIKTETQLEKSFADFDSEDMEALIKNLTLKLDTFKHNVKGLEETTEAKAGF